MFVNCRVTSTDVNWQGHGVAVTAETPDQFERKGGVRSIEMPGRWSIRTRLCRESTLFLFPIPHRERARLETVLIASYTVLVLVLPNLFHPTCTEIVCQCILS